MNRRAMKGLWGFEAVALLGGAVEAVKEWVLNPKCPVCPSRPANLECHVTIDHAGDDDLFRSRQ